MDYSEEVTSIILAGGQGSRLYPLTQKRSKPAVPIAGNFRLIDIPISNCLHSNIRKIWVVTQFASASLHQHIASTYHMDLFNKGFISLLAASQTVGNSSWYQGTADAVRKNLEFFKRAKGNILILSGDHLYQMDYKKFTDFHIENDADISISVIPVPRKDVSELGILKASPTGEVEDFIEKPQDPAIIDSFASDLSQQKEKSNNSEPAYLASMGIYLFKKEVLFDILNNCDHEDFGKQIIPEAISKYKTMSYLFEGYWEDIGTVKAFFDAHIALTRSKPEFNFYDEDKPIYTRPRFLPPAKVNASNIHSSLISEGAIIDQSTIRDSVIGIRSRIHEGCDLEKVVMMGGDIYGTSAQRPDVGMSPGIGRNSVIKNAIIDKNARIGKNVQLSNINNIQDGEFGDIYIKDGIIIVPKNVTVPDNFQL